MVYQGKQTKDTREGKHIFRYATYDDMESILKIYERARTFMAQSGNPNQWGTNRPPRALLAQDIDEKRLFLYEQNGQIEAVFAFILGEDPTYRQIEDGAWLDDTLPYGTIHRLASAGRHSGVSARVIAWCAERCDSLRADTHADNKIMQHLLEQNGFVRCGIIHLVDGAPRIAYQRMKTSILNH